MEKNDKYKIDYFFKGLRLSEFLQEINVCYPQIKFEPAQAQLDNSAPENDYCHIKIPGKGLPMLHVVGASPPPPSQDATVDWPYKASPDQGEAPPAFAYCMLSIEGIRVSVHDHRLNWREVLKTHIICLAINMGVIDDPFSTNDADPFLPNPPTLYNTLQPKQKAPFAEQSANYVATL